MSSLEIRISSAASSQDKPDAEAANLFTILLPDPNGERIDGKVINHEIEFTDGDQRIMRALRGNKLLKSQVWETSIYQADTTIANFPFVWAIRKPIDAGYDFSEFGKSNSFIGTLATAYGFTKGDSVRVRHFLNRTPGSIQQESFEGAEFDLLVPWVPAIDVFKLLNSIKAKDTHIDEASKEPDTLTIPTRRVIVDRQTRIRQELSGQRR